MAVILLGPNALFIPLDTMLMLLYHPIKMLAITKEAVMGCVECGMDRTVNAHGECHDCYFALRTCTCPTLDGGGDCDGCIRYYGVKEEAPC